MRADLLHVILVINNPVGFESREKLFHKSVQHMLDSGCCVHVVECVYGDLPPKMHEIPHVNYIRVAAKSHVWIKENLVNIGISRLPPDWKYVAWVDADITFRKSGWAAETVKALQHFDVIQPWEYCYDLGPNDEHMDLHRSFCRQWIKDRASTAMMGAGYTFAHPGYAWAATRHALESVGGLMDHAICGAGDHHMALSLIGKAHLSMPGGITGTYARLVNQWQTRAMRHVATNIGFIPFNIEHAFHGKKEDRKYIDRWKIITNHKFDPDTDIKKNTHGVVELAGNKPELKRDLWQYFRQRNEDATTI